MTEPPLLPLSMRFDYEGRCWWCGDPADSREHKWKRSDLVRMFGPGPYRGEVSWGRGEYRCNPQGASSSHLKFAANLCRRCNNERSQPFDRAYDTWASWIIQNLDSLQQADQLLLSDAFESDSTNKVTQLARYFVKHVGCRIADEGVKVPDDFIAFLDGGSRPASLRAGLGIRSDLEALNDQLRQDGMYEALGLWMRPLLCWYSPSAGAVVEAWSGVSLGPLEFWYWLKLCDSAEPNFAACFPSLAVPLLRYGAEGPVEQAWHADSPRL